MKKDVSMANSSTLSSENNDILQEILIMSLVVFGSTFEPDLLGPRLSVNADN